MKTSMEIPDELVRDIKILAAREGKKLKEIVAESLEARLRQASMVPETSLRDLKPVSVGEVFHPDPDADRLEEMLNERGHRY